MTDMPRLQTDMATGAARLRERAAGYSMAGDYPLSNLAALAAAQMNAALKALQRLNEAERS